VVTRLFAALKLEAHHLVSSPPYECENRMRTCPCMHADAAAD